MRTTPADLFDGDESVRLELGEVHGQVAVRQAGAGLQVLEVGAHAQIEREQQRQPRAEVPPRVDYTITALGSEMLDSVAPLWLWAGKTVQRFHDRRAAFDRREILRAKK